MRNEYVDKHSELILRLNAAASAMTAVVREYADPAPAGVLSAPLWKAVELEDAAHEFYAVACAIRRNLVRASLHHETKVEEQVKDAIVKDEYKTHSVCPECKNTNFVRVGMKAGTDVTCADCDCAYSW